MEPGSRYPRQPRSARAIVKLAAVPEERYEFKGPARVYEGEDEAIEGLRRSEIRARRGRAARPRSARRARDGFRRKLRGGPNEPVSHAADGRRTLRLEQGLNHRSGDARGGRRWSSSLLEEGTRSRSISGVATSSCSSRMASSTPENPLGHRHLPLGSVDGSRNTLASSRSKGGDPGAASFRSQTGNVGGGFAIAESEIQPAVSLSQRKQGSRLRKEKPWIKLVESVKDGEQPSGR